MHKPFSQACENNKEPILCVLNQYLKGDERILEIGSGTGQHAKFFAEQMPEVNWQTSDLVENHSGIHAWIDDHSRNNILAPIELDVSQSKLWPSIQYDAIYTANTLHIMSWLEVETMFSMLPTTLKSKGLFFAYGPFNFNGEFTSQSNREFDALLKSRKSTMGLRDIEDIQRVAAENRLRFLKKHIMPANNFLITFHHDES